MSALFSLIFHTFYTTPLEVLYQTVLADYEHFIADEKWLLTATKGPLTL
jgi:hypothetical protein